MFTGASNPGNKRLYELVVGAQKANKDGACFNIPPMYYSAKSLKSA